MPRWTTLAGQLARLGFADPARAERLLAAAGGGSAAGADGAAAGGGGAAWGDGAAGGDGGVDLGLAELAATAADPDLALASLVRLLPNPGLRTAVDGDPGLRARLMAVLGTSAALGDHLARHADDWRLLRGEAPLPVPSAAELRDDLLAAVDTAAAPVVALRVAYRRRLLTLAARDLTGQLDLEEVTAELSDLAVAALEASLAIARSQLPAEAAACRLAVIAMGKCGARELNYASDVDVIFVASPAAGAGEETALRAATLLAAAVIRTCSQSTPEGELFPVDPNLRPEGRDGPLVRTLASHRAYYQRWAKTWEFQALLKARPVAGDLDLGRQYTDALAPLVWQAATRENFVADTQAMRRRVVGTLPAAGAERQLKLGPGGLRDVEFAVQLLQLVHGRTDETLHVAATLPALAALAEGGYVGRDDAAGLADAYRFLRRVEHLVQLRQLRRTHTLPDDPALLRSLGRALRQAGQPRSHADPAEDLLAQWRRHAREVQRLHEKLFYRPLLDAVARLPGTLLADGARLTPQAAGQRLEALGYADPAGALRHLEALTSGVTRRSAIQRTLLPLMLGWFADSPAPDAGLLAFRQVSEALGGTPWYLRLLRDDLTVAQRMARVLASSRYATDLLLRQPETVALLRDNAELEPPPLAALAAEAASLAERHPAAADAAVAIRGLRRRELLRAALADLLADPGVDQTGETLTSVTVVTIEAALRAAIRAAEAERGPLPTRFAVVAMGRFGGHETGYGSDADVMFVHDPRPGVDEREATDAAHALAEELRALLSRPGPDLPLHLDPGLRPEGRQGPLVRTLASYRAYYQRWSVAWEPQALLRAEPVAGEPELWPAFTSLIDEFRYPDGGIPPSSVREIRRLKARMEAERIPRGVDPNYHLKLGPGGLSDVEWVVQLLQLRHAHAQPGLRTTRTLAALAAADAAGLMAGGDAAALAEAWRLASRIRNAAVLVLGRASDVIPARQSELAAVASVLGYRPGAAQDMVQDYRRAARRARSVTERLFYG